MKTAAVLSIGDELTLGQTLDTNASSVSQKLTDAGLRVVEHVTVADDLDRIVSAMTRLTGAVSVLVVTGGLGPTADDLTREALARVSGEALVVDEAALAEVRGWFAGRGAAMPERNAVQALRPASARRLRNERGTAPGVAMRLARGAGWCEVVCLPGPPRELAPMLDAVLGELAGHDDGAVIATRSLATFGLGESTVAERLGEMMERGRNPVVGTTASRGIVTCRVRYEGAQGDAGAALDAVERAIRARLGHAVLGEGGEDDPLVESVAALLAAREETVCTIESCTGGLVAGSLTDRAGSSAWFLGGVVSYANRLKEVLAGVDAGLIERHGAVSAEVALAMARGGREACGADHAVSVTGIAGPGGGSPEKPVGTVWIGYAGPGGTAEARRFRFSGDRGGVRGWAARAALGVLRLRLLGVEMALLGEQERR